MSVPSAQTDVSSLPASEGLQLLLDASAMLLASARVDRVLAGIVGLAQQVIQADAYAVWRTRDGLHWRVLASHGLSPSYRTELRSAGFETEVRVVEDVYADPVLRQHSQTYRQEGIRSMMVMPLRLQRPMPEGPNAGTITFYWRTPHRASERDISFATALANLSSAALNISELHEQNQQEKSRLAFLAEASALLASSLDYEATLDRVARLAVPHVADWCTIHVLEGGVPNRLVVAHADPEMLEFARTYSARFPEEIREDRGLGLALRNGQTEYVPLITEEMLQAGIPEPERLAMVRKLGLASAILVPLKSRGKVLGAIRLMTSGSRHFTQDDVRLAEDLALRAATAIENAQLHRAVLEQQSTLRLALSAAKMGSWSFDLAKGQSWFSEEFKLLHGLAADAEVAYVSGGFVHPEERERVLGQLHAALASDASLLAVEHRALRADGKAIWVASSGRIQRDEAGKAVGIAGITIDVTERRQAEEALRRTEKLAAAGRLAATVSHEINNPLESVVNLVYLSRLTGGLPVEVQEYLGTAEEELHRIAQIVRQTLGFYRESVSPRKSDIAEIVAETCALYRSRLQARSLEIELDLEPELSAYVIAGELKQVLANLISNAADASTAGGVIRISATREGGQVLVAVEDSGSGIAAADLPRIFEPFFTTKSDVGTGLGLWVSQGIVDKHGGTIEVRTSTDAVAHGTTFTVRLPLLAEQSAA
jgi:PAS domain S-box-containing protein